MLTIRQLTIFVKSPVVGRKARSTMNSAIITKKLNQQFNNFLK